MGPIDGSSHDCLCHLPEAAISLSLPVPLLTDAGPCVGLPICLTPFCHDPKLRSTYNSSLTPTLPFSPLSLSFPS